MSRSLLAVVIAASFTLIIAVSYADEAESKVKAVCPVSGKPIVKEHSLPYKETAKVYFCCPNCPKAFEADTAKFAPKANLQLVATEQAKEVKCPLSGKALDSEKSTKVAGVEVSFCCGNCLAAVNKAEGDEKVKLVFSDEAFKKGFELKKAK